MQAGGVMAYSDIERLVAVEIVNRLGGSITPDVLAEVRAAIGKPVTAPSIRAWIRSQEKFKKENLLEKNGDGPDLLKQVEQTLDAMFEEVARAMLARALTPEVIVKMGGRDLVIAAATAYDKMRLARGLPTEIIQVLPGVLDALNKLGLNPVEMFNAIIAEAAERDNQR